MRTTAPSRTAPLLAVAAAVLALAGCSLGGSGAAEAGPGMMGGGSGYHRSTLTCQAPATLPGRPVHVLLADMGMTRMMGGDAPVGAHMMLRAAPRRLAAGRISIVAANRGRRTHEMVVLPLAAGQHAGERAPGADGRVDEAGSLGEASATCRGGTGEGIRAGAVGWTTVTLAPGRYELVCNLRNHYADGMHAEIRVG